MKTRTLVSCIGLPVLLAGCGGSGSDGGLNANIPTDPVAITSVNGATVTTEALGADELATGAALGIQVENPTTTTILAVANDVARRYLKDSQGSTPAGVTQSGSYNCTGGGSVSVSGTTTGFANDGTYLGPPASISLRMNFKSCLEAGVTLIGDLNFSIEEAVDYDLSISIYGSSLQALAEPEYGALQNFSFVLTMPFDPAGNLEGNTTYDFDYVVSSTSIGGSVTVETDVPYEIDLNTGYPLAGGHTFIDGANGASLSLTALGGTGITLELDTEGDGVFEQPLPVSTWSELAAADWSDPGFATLW